MLFVVLDRVSGHHLPITSHQSLTSLPKPSCQVYNWIIRCNGSTPRKQKRILEFERRFAVDSRTTGNGCYIFIQTENCQTSGYRDVGLNYRFTCKHRHQTWRFQKGYLRCCRVVGQALKNSQSTSLDLPRKTSASSCQQNWVIISWHPIFSSQSFHRLRDSIHVWRENLSATGKHTDNLALKWAYPQEILGKLRIDRDWSRAYALVWS